MRNELLEVIALQSTRRTTLHPCGDRSDGLWPQASVVVLISAMSNEAVVVVLSPTASHALPNLDSGKQTGLFSP
jgi:hypothetical protein